MSDFRSIRGTFFFLHFEVALQSRSATIVKMALLKCSHHFLWQKKLHVDSGWDSINMHMHRKQKKYIFILPATSCDPTRTEPSHLNKQHFHSCL